MLQRPCNHVSANKWEYIFEWYVVGPGNLFLQKKGLFEISENKNPSKVIRWLYGNDSTSDSTSQAIARDDFTRSRNLVIGYFIIYYY